MLKAVHVKKCLRDYIFVPHSYDLSCMKVRESLGVLKSLKIKQLVLIQDFLSPLFEKL